MSNASPYSHVYSTTNTIECTCKKIYEREKIKNLSFASDHHEVTESHSIILFVPLSNHYVHGAYVCSVFENDLRSCESTNMFKIRIEIRLPYTK